MDNIIRPMREGDRAAVIAMMREFYNSEAVLTNGSKEIFREDFNACVSENPYLEGYVFEKNGEILGYSMLAKSFSTEFGKPCIWIEDLFLKKESCGMGLGSAFLKFVGEKYPDSLHRLEVEKENEPAMKTYMKSGFEEIPYTEMKR